MKSLKGKIGVVTGAGKGIGRATAERLASYGAKIVLADLDEPNLNATLAKITQNGGEATTVVANVSLPKEAKKIADHAVQKFGTVDLLVNNAGILRDASLFKTTEEQFDAVIAVNLKGVFLCAQACAQIMKDKKYGKIVNISSVAAHGNFGQTNYSAAKAGVVGMTKTWALELSRYNINVNAIAPGLIATDMTASIPEEFRKKMIELIPLKRQGEANEVAELISFLCSDDSSYIQGEVIGINGGYLM